MSHAEPSFILPQHDVARMYAPELLSELQSLLAALADIDFEYESDLATIRASATEEWLKRATIRKLQQRHRERREHYARQLDAVQEHIRTMSADVQRHAQR